MASRANDAPASAIAALVRNPVVTEPALFWTVLAGLGLLIACGVALRWLLPVIAAHFGGSRGGWSRLAEAYRTAQPPPAQTMRAQTIVVGRILYRRCVTVGLDRSGLYLDLPGLLRIARKPALLIPWHAFGAPAPARLYWREAALFPLGEPVVGTITVPMPLLKAMRAYLPHT